MQKEVIIINNLRSNNNFLLVDFKDFSQLDTNTTLDKDLSNNQSYNFEKKNLSPLKNFDAYSPLSFTSRGQNFRQKI